MASNLVEQARVAVTLDGRDAQQALTELTGDVNKYTDALLRAYQAGDKDALKKANTGLKSAERNLETFKKQTFETANVLKNLNGSSLKDLQRAEREIVGEMAKMTRGTQEYIAANKDLKNVRTEIGKVKTEMGGIAQQTGILSKIKGLLPIGIIATATTGIINFGKEIFNITKTIQGETIRSTTVFGDQLGYVEGEADKLARKMGVTNREFVSMAAATADLLIPLDFSRKQAAEMSTQLQGLTGALDEWTAGSVGAKQISEILTKAMLGETEQLKQLGIAIRKDSDEYRNLVKQKQQQTGATKAQAEAMATLELIQRKSVDAQNAYLQDGNKLLRFQKESGRIWRELKENVAGWFIIDTPGKLRKEQDEVNKLVVQLNSANISEETRAILLERLKKMAPDIAKAIETEGTNTKTLTTALEAYNTQMALKILMAEQEAKIADQKNAVSRQQEKLTRKEAEVIKNLNDNLQYFQKNSYTYSKEFTDNFQKIVLDDKLTILEKAKQASAIISDPFLDQFVSQYEKANIKLEDKNKTLEQLVQESAETVANYKNIIGGNNDETVTPDPNKPTGPSEEELKAAEEKQKKALKKFMAEAKKAAKEISDTADDTYKSWENLIKAIDDSVENMVDDSIDADTRYINEKLKNEEDFHKKRGELITEYSVLNADEMQSLELMRLKELYDGKLGYEEEYQKFKKAIEDKYADIAAETDDKTRQEKLAKVRESYAEIEAVANQATSLYMANQDLELAKLKNTYDAKIKAAGDDKEKVAKLEEELAAKTKAIKKKQANAEFIITSAQIIANTSMAVAKVWGQTGIAGVIAQAAPIAMGISELATANKQRQIAMQAKRGRYPVIGAEDGKLYNAEYYGPLVKPGVINNGRETLINEGNRPEYIIDANTTDNIARLNPALFKTIEYYRVPQRAEGKYPATNTTTAQQTQPAENKELLAALVQLNQLLNRGIKAKVLLSDYETAQAEKERILKHARGE